jgi:hypothetical protein
MLNTPLAPDGTLRRRRQAAGVTGVDLVAWVNRHTSLPLSLTTLMRIERAEMGLVRRYIRPDERRVIEAGIQALGA